MQYEQRIEIRIDNGYKTPELAKLVEHDVRATFYDKAQSSQLLDTITSPYVIFAQSNSAYMEGCVNHIFDRLHMIEYKNECAEKGVKPTPLARERYIRGEHFFPADVVVFNDSAKIVRNEDPFFALTPNYQLSYSSEKIYSYEALAPRVYNVVSLSPENKAYHVDFLKKHHEIWNAQQEFLLE